MGADMAQNEVETLLDEHPEIPAYQWKHHGQELYVMLDDGKLAGRSFISDLENHGFSVKFVDFASNRIGFTRD